MTSQASYENAVGEAEASEAASASEKLQRHRSYHFSQTKPSKTRKSSSRRATSVRVKPTFLEDEDPNLPEPPVCIKVASPEPEEDLEDKVEHTNTLRAEASGGHGGRRRSLPRVPVYASMTPAAEENVYHNDQRKWSQTSFTPMDQFDEFFYKSTHYGQNFPPEVNIEVPSDSDSSRRPSKYTLSNASSTHDLSYANEERKNTVGNFLQNAESSRRVSQPQNALAGDFLEASGGPRHNLIDRRKSHTGVTPMRRLSAKRRPRQGSGQAQMLSVPNCRPRGSSLPGNIEVVNQDDIYRLRNFSTSGKKIINRGDSLKARSKSSLCSTNSSVDILSSRTNSEQDFTGSEASSRRPSKGSRRGSFKAIEEAPAKQYRVTMLGASGVGKSSLTSQFLSSDHMNTYDTVEDDVQKIVSVCVDGKEAQMVFIDHAHTDMAIENQIATYMPDGYMVVFAVDDSESLEEAESILNYLKSEEILSKHAVILVANKTDLVRSRVISTSGGKSMAIKFGCKYIETSPGINHNVDELLVGMLTQIQLRSKLQDSETGAEKKKGGGLKVLDLLEKVWKMQDSKSKSCSNLHIL